MNSFPLAPFLAALAADGIIVALHDYRRISLALQAGETWTLARLRGVLQALLVSNEEQEAVFLRRFEHFFDPLAAETLFPQLDLDRALQDLRTVAEQPVLRRDLVRPERRISRFVLWIATPLRALRSWSVAVCDVVTSWFESVRVWIRTSANDPLPSITPEDFPSETVLHLSSDIVLQWNPDAPRAFHLELLGGKPAPRLDAATMDYLADALGYFRSEQPSHHLNVPASIAATGRNGGMPTPVYFHRKQLRSVLVLEDQYSAALVWNPIAAELADGLLQRGVPVLFGRFRGSPQRFSTPDGTSYDLEDLEDQRQGYLLLVFSDGKGLRPHLDTFVLEALARWPQVAWMELREPRAWDDSTARVARAGLSIYPANRDGLLQIMTRFASEHGEALASRRETPDWHGVPPYQGMSKKALAAYIETLLGDALPWVQACAMLQPITIGMADTVRRQFCIDLPAERIERLFALPNTEQSVSGIRFSPPVLAVLREGFSVRWQEKEQEVILRFLLAKFQDIEPEPKDSLAHLTWEWMRERVHLELNPAQALPRLVALAQTPLGNAIREDMESHLPSGQAEEGAIEIPLRIPLQGEDSRRQFSFLIGGHFVPLWSSEIRDNVGIEFVLIPAGDFLMGSNDADADKDEQPIHKVIISRPFYLGKYEVTQAQWQAVIGENPSHFKGEKQPVEQVSWDDVQKFVRRLNDKEGREVYRLPTEAEWEYAARAGSTTAFSFGDDHSQLGEYAWYSENSGNDTHPVGTRKANAWGLHDMHGNVWEWVQDWYGRYEAETVTDPVGPVSGSYRGARGGGWYDDAGYCRSAYRSHAAPVNRGHDLGFRLLRTAS